jgi:hypothetical protein
MTWSMGPSPFSASESGHDLKQLFPARWTTVLAGWRGVGPYRRLLSPTEIAAFATERLESATAADPDLAELALASDADTDHIDSRLARCAAAEQGDYERELRKWIVVLLRKKMRELPADPLYGLLDLTDFWSALDYPAYALTSCKEEGTT